MLLSNSQKLPFGAQNPTFPSNYLHNVETSHQTSHDTEKSPRKTPISSSSSPIDFVFIMVRFGRFLPELEGSVQSFFLYVNNLEKGCKLADDWFEDETLIPFFSFCFFPSNLTFLLSCFCLFGNYWEGLKVKSSHCSTQFYFTAFDFISFPSLCLDCWEGIALQMHAVWGIEESRTQSSQILLFLCFLFFHFLFSPVNISMNFQLIFLEPSC